MVTKKARRHGKYFNVIDKEIPLPEEQKDLVDGGNLHFILNSKVMKNATKFTNSLIRSRNLPVNVETIVAADPVVAHLLETTDMDELKAVEEAKHYYLTEKERCSTDALIIALTYQNKLKNDPRPYEEGEVAFDESHLDEDGDPVPDWMREDQPIPSPFKDLKNMYERRLKSVYDLLNDCGIRFSSQFYSIFNRELAEAIRELIDERDEDGFRNERTGGPLHAHTDADNSGEGEDAK